MVVMAYINNYSKEMAYDMFGVGRVYLSILVVMIVLVLIMTRHMPQRTVDTAGTRYSMEWILVAMYFLSDSMYMPVVNLVCYINEKAGNIRFPLDFGILSIMLFCLA